MENFSATDLRAFKLRFKGVFTDGRVIIFELPNGLDIFTFHPKFAEKIVEAEYKGPKIGEDIEKGSVFVTANGEDFEFPSEGKVIDTNEDLGSNIKSFALGPTSNYILIMKPNKGMRIFEAPYEKIC